MALTAIGPHLLELDAASTGQPSVGKASDVIDCAVEILGSRGPATRNLAMKGLQRSMLQVDLEGPVLFGTEEQASSNLVLDDPQITLPNNSFAIRAVQLTYKTGDFIGKVAYTLLHERWDQRNELNGGAQPTSGLPRTWLAKNPFSDGYLELNPAPDTTSVADYKMLLTIVQAMPEVTSEESDIWAPAVYKHVLCCFTELFLLERRKVEDKEAIKEKRKEAYRALAKAKARDMPGADGWFQIKIAGRSYSTGAERREAGVAYI